MAIELIGFEHDDQNLSAVWGSQTVRESLLIKMDSPLQDVLDVQAALPAYDGGITPEPTFTIGRSYHPERPDLVLREAPSVRVHPEGGRPYFLVDLVYETATWLDKVLPEEDQGRGNVGRKKRLDGSNNIKFPWDEPPTWSGGSESVRFTVYKEAFGPLLRHANQMPLTEGIDVDLMLESHTFTWNVPYDTFTWADDIGQYIGKVNSEVCFNCAPTSVLLKSCTAVENYRTVNIPLSSGESSTGSTATHHFVTITATFLIDERGKDLDPLLHAGFVGYFREANRRVSMHTMELANIGTILVPVYAYRPIKLNEIDNVKAPWPMLSQSKATELGLLFGMGYPYDLLPTADPTTDFHIIDPEYPIQADLHTFVANNGLVIP